MTPAAPRKMAVADSEENWETFLIAMKMPDKQNVIGHKEINLYVGR